MFSKTPVASLAGMAGVASVLGWLIGAGVSVLAMVGVAGPVQAGTTDFVSTWKTDNTSSGSSAVSQVRLPLESGGTYDFAVDWESDGTVDETVTAWDEATHTYHLTPPAPTLHDHDPFPQQVQHTGGLAVQLRR